MIEIDGIQHFQPRSFASDTTSDYKNLQLIKIIRNDRLKQDFAVNTKKLHVLRIDYKTVFEEKVGESIKAFLQKISTDPVPRVHYTNELMYLTTLNRYIAPLIGGETPMKFTEYALHSFNEGVDPYNLKIKELEDAINSRDAVNDKTSDNAASEASKKRKTDDVDIASASTTAVPVIKKMKATCINNYFSPVTNNNCNNTNN